MSTYRKIFDTVEEAIFIHKIPTVGGIAKYVASTLGLSRVNNREIEKIVHEASTQYKNKKEA